MRRACIVHPSGDLHAPGPHSGCPVVARQPQFAHGGSPRGNGEHGRRLSGDRRSGVAVRIVLRGHASLQRRSLAGTQVDAHARRLQSVPSGRYGGLAGTEYPMRFPPFAVGRESAGLCQVPRREVPDCRLLVAAVGLRSLSAAGPSQHVRRLPVADCPFQRFVIHQHRDRWHLPCEPRIKGCPSAPVEGLGANDRLVKTAAAGIDGNR